MWQREPVSLAGGLQHHGSHRVRHALDDNRHLDPAVDDLPDGIVNREAVGDIAAGGVHVERDWPGVVVRKLAQAFDDIASDILFDVTDEVDIAQAVRGLLPKDPFDRVDEIEYETVVEISRRRHLVPADTIAQIDGNADFAKPYWPQLQKWAEYLEAKGFDTENQLCTDDFAGHLAHNVNLSAKAIEALGAYAKLCGLRGDKENENKYHKLAQDMAQKWIKAANDGDHFRLAFDRPGTWSQKYNLAWDRILELNLFPPEVTRKEIAFYLKKQNRYGLPLDNRKAYTKLDWILWTATMAESQKDFEALVSPILRFLNETPDRVPMTDWFWTDKPRKKGFQARSVVGGVFMKMLADRAMWKKWANRDKHTPWAPLPTSPEMIKPVVPDARVLPISWRFTTQKPPDDWYKADFDDGSWKEGPGGFGTAGTPGALVRTEWKTADIWLRRAFDFPQAAFHDLQFSLHHDEDVEIYLNGVLAAEAKGFITDYELVPIRSAAKAALKPGGKNMLAVHCHQTTGGQYIDVGIVDVVDLEAKK